MNTYTYLQDKDFLKRLDNEHNKFYWVKIEMLDSNEKPIQSIEGRVKSGSGISIDGKSSVRRTCNISFIAEEDTNDLTNINNLLSINKKIKIYVGLDNHIDSRYDEIIWFPQGVFVIEQPSITHNGNSCTISLSCKDKMSLLNGSCGGTFPASVTFHEYSQVIGERRCEGDPAVVITEPNEYTVYSYEVDDEIRYKTWRRLYGWETSDASKIGQIVDIPQRFYDIIQTLVCNYGGESLDRIFINDVPLEIKQLVRYTGSGSLYYNPNTGYYTTNADYVKRSIEEQKYIAPNEVAYKYHTVWGIDSSRSIDHSMDGWTFELYSDYEWVIINGDNKEHQLYYYKDGSLFSSDQNCYYLRRRPDGSIFDDGFGTPWNPYKRNHYPWYDSVESIMAAVDNVYKQFQDSESAIAYLTRDKADSGWQVFNYNEDVGYVYTDFVYPGQLISNIGDNVCTILDKIKTTLGNFEYFYDVEGNFVFQQIKNYLNTSYDATDSYRIDNNRRVEIDQNNLAVIDDTNYKVDFNSASRSVYTFAEGGGLVSSFANTPIYSNLKNDFHIWGINGDKSVIHYHLAIKEKPTEFGTYQVVFTEKNGEYTGGLRLAGASDEAPETYVPADWRAELYLRGLEKQKLGIRPDIYEQELLDLFDGIYNFKDKCFKADLVLRPNDLNYFFDYLQPVSSLYDCSVDAIGPRLYSFKKDKVVRLYNTDVPNQILIPLGLDNISREKIIARCEREGQAYSNIDSNVYLLLSLGTIGYTAQEEARNLLYQYTNYNESITIQCIPIYYLEPNTRITVYDSSSGVYGDYIIKSITMPIGSGNMSISATKVQGEKY